MKNIRESVVWAARLMEGTLRRNDNKPPWEQQSIYECKKKLLEEQAEFFAAIELYQESPDSEELAAEVINEGVDYMICIHNLITKHDYQMGQLERGRNAS